MLMLQLGPKSSADLRVASRKCVKEALGLCFSSSSRKSSSVFVHPTGWTFQTRAAPHSQQNQQRQTSKSVKGEELVNETLGQLSALASDASKTSGPPAPALGRSPFGTCPGVKDAARCWKQWLEPRAREESRRILSDNNWRTSAGWSQIQTEWDRCTDTCVHVVLSPAWCSRFFEICCCALLQDVCMMHDDLVWHWPLSASGEVGSAQVKGLKWTSFQEEKDVGNAWNAACDTCYYCFEKFTTCTAKPTKQALDISGNGFCLEHFAAWQKCPSLNCHGSCGDRGKAAERLGVFGQSWGSQSCSALDEILHISRSKHVETLSKFHAPDKFLIAFAFWIKHLRCLVFGIQWRKSIRMTRSCMSFGSSLIVSPVGHGSASSQAKVIDRHRQARQAHWHAHTYAHTHTEITQPRDCWSTIGKSSPAKQIRGLRTKLASGRLKAISSRRASRQLQIFRLAPYGTRKRRGQPQDRKKPTAVEKTKRVEKTWKDCMSLISLKECGKRVHRMFTECAVTCDLFGAVQDLKFQ